MLLRFAKPQSELHPCRGRPGFEVGVMLPTNLGLFLGVLNPLRSFLLLVVGPGYRRLSRRSEV
jgi:hypothetical protein